MIQTSLTGLGSLGHPGIFMGQTKTAGLTNHVDIPYVTSLVGSKGEGLNFGLLDLYALKQRANSPLLTLGIDNASIIYSDEDYYNFELPVAGDATTRLVSGGLDREKFGMDDEEIPFIVTRRDLGPGSTFKFDMMSPVQFTVVNRQIEEMGTHYKLWAKLNTNAYVPYVTKADFVPGRQIFKLADLTGFEFGSNKPTWSISGEPSIAKYKNFLSRAYLAQSYKVSSGAVHYLESNTRFDGAKLKAMQQQCLWFYSINSISESKIVDVRNPEHYKNYWQQLQEAKAKGLGHAKFVNFLDDICIGLMLKQNNTLLMWSDTINQYRDGYDTTRLIPGVWFQLDRAGYRHSYSIPLFTLDVITDAIKDFEGGKVEDSDWINNKEYVIRTGRGGQEMIHNEFLKRFKHGVPAQMMNSDHGWVTGDANNLVVKETRVVKYQIPGTGWLRVELEPGFDPIFTDDILNPIVMFGRRLTSFTMLIEDHNLSKDNVVIVRRNGNRIKMNVRNGDEAHPLFKSTHNIAGQNIDVVNGSDELSGYEVKFRGRADSAIVKDPTRLLKLTPKNPKTGLLSI